MESPYRPTKLTGVSHSCVIEPKPWRNRTRRKAGVRKLVPPRKPSEKPPSHPKRGFLKQEQAAVNLPSPKVVGRGCDA